MKIIDFKSVSPLFEQERDGDKPFNIRKVDNKDVRFKALSQWSPERDWGLRITNPQTSESFIRRIINVSYLWYYDCSGDIKPGLQGIYDWRIITMGELIT